VTRWAVVVIGLGFLVLAATLAGQAQVSSDGQGTTVAPPPAPSSPPAGGDAAAQRTIFGPGRRTTIVLGAILVVVALGLFAAGVRRGPRVGRKPDERQAPVTRGRDDRAA